MNNGNPNIQVLKAGETGIFTNYIYKAIPLAFDESMSYYECLCGLLNYLQNTIIPTVNNNADAVSELQGLYVELKNYVDNYFTNLDVQEEINNKLDEMAEDGSLTNLIKNYVDPIQEAFEQEVNNDIQAYKNQINAENNTFKTNMTNSFNSFTSTTNATVNQIDQKVNSATSGSPLVASSTSEMTDTTRVYVNTTDGYWYYYNGSTWVQGGVYQSTGLTTDKTLTLIDEAPDSNIVGNVFENNNKSFKIENNVYKSITEITKTSGQVLPDGSTYATDSYFHTQLFKVQKDDVIKVQNASTLSNVTIRYVTAYKNETAIAASGSSSNLDSYTVPEGINYVILTVSASYIGADVTGNILLQRNINYLSDIYDKSILDRLSKVDGYITPELEYGSIIALTTGWTYSNDITKVRTKENVSYRVHEGSVIGLKNYTNYRYQIGYKKLDNTYNATNFLTEDYTMPFDADIVILIRNKTNNYKNITVDEIRDIIKIYDPYNTVDQKLETVEVPDFILPSTSTAIIGTEWNLYFQNVLTNINENFYIDVSGITGKIFERFFRVTPVQADLGNHTITLMLKNRKTNQTVKSASFTLKVINNGTISKRGIFIGDSLTQEGGYINQIQNVLSNGNIVSVGTRTETDTPGYTIYHEGRSGWSAYDYTEQASKGNVTNAFWNSSTSSFDFSYYMATNNFSNIDFVMLNLGTNGYNQTSRTIDAISEMITSIHDYDPNIKIFVSLIPPATNQDGCGQHNGMFSSGNYKYYQLLLIQNYLSNFQDEIENVYVTEAYFNIDIQYDFPRKTVAVSSRNPYEITINDNNVHLNRYGYLKLADVYYNNLLRRL